ncbi:G-type lectin S-receptor-like serine/threonine-protein kinase-like [Dorcoceras hygrometricum]|uniref:Receptor-like serine/threonine-protein kinase n=1 Tax=Dorcoceras hygrometricum TaxID=472368 RepID=A0A2Z7CYS7_9LAMI|nr:G-type lectin S-receptor-like serine/threonine-protein kinase-like [Dorcoceras hygrometricum]
MGSSATIAWSPFCLTSSFNRRFAIILLCCMLFPSALSGPVYSSISPNFTASYYHYIDTSGAFLASRNGSFQAQIINLKPENRSFYLVVVHVSSRAIIWSANRNTPISESSEFRFSRDGMTLFNDQKQPIWSTPHNLAPVTSLQLLESGNLVMLDGANNTLWESFDLPTDVIVAGQRLNVGKSLVASNSDGDLADGICSLVVGNNDAMIRWNGMNYWELSMAPNAVRNAWAVEYMVMNYTGVYLMGKNGAQVVIRIPLHSSDDVVDDPSAFRIMKLESSGVVSVLKLSSGGSSKQEFKTPDDSCRIPSTCWKLGYCTNGGTCQCAPGFHSASSSSEPICVPTDGSLALPGPCNGSQPNITNIKYSALGRDVDYFSNDFSNPMLQNVNLTACKNLCSGNCSCLGFFYSQGSGSCYVIENQIGSMATKMSWSTDKDRLGYIKTIVVGTQIGVKGSKKSDFPVLVAILLPSGVMVIAMVAFLIWLRRRRIKRRWSRSMNSKLGRGSSMSAEEEMDFVSIPGLPVRFVYEELVIATESFKTQIGSGGFGTVYKGTLEDGEDVAVKKITCLGAQGRREFLTEIAVIGKIHHVNLVRLKGFCAHGGQKFLVYEFMDRGSLDATLFRADPVMEWKERYNIALGTARGLAYLHTGCEHKIIHCDVKPENILLHDKSQVKISDFGLSKLLSPEESNLFTTLRGTRGYLAPEWLTSSAISDKTDVYSYGMVLLEIIRGKKNSSPQMRSANSRTDSNRGNSRSSPSSVESGQRPIYFPLFVLDMHEEGRYMGLADPRLMGRVASEEVEKLVRIALCCVQEEPNLRPSMANVVGMLEGVMPLGEPQLESLNFLRFYGRRFTEESRLGGDDEQNELRLYRQPTGTNTSSSYNSLSYMSSQEVSGPR